ncbi:MAG: asparagine synthase (glutamine-hydrolyzing) [Wenzhouxiangella sp.]
MCGIAGLIWKSREARRIDDFRAAAALMVHRGPDGHGEFVDDRLMLVHYRLAILDLSPAGHQPFELHDEHESIGVYNGELYNFREIAESRGIEQKTTCDTEIVLKGVARFGPEILSEYNGIFAFAQYFPREGSLLLARDRLGVKPLYFIDTPGYFAFASEAKALYAFMQTLPLNPVVLREFLSYGSSMSCETIVAGVNKVPPGSSLMLNLENFQIETRSFWSVASLADQSPPDLDYASAKAEVKSRLGGAVKRQLLSDVPVGAYLSGGLDSSLIVALAARQSASPIKTFSVQFEGSPETELPLARQVAERYGTEHHEIEVSPRDLLPDLDRLILQYDEPFADPAAMPLHLMGARCAPMAKVILQGDGGDELFAGYGRHLDVSQYWRRVAAFGALSKVHPNKQARQRFASRFDDLSARPLALRLAKLTGNPSMDLLARVTKEPLRSRLAGVSAIRTFELAATTFAHTDRLTQVMLADMIAILPHTFLDKVDKVSMWHGIEARVPLLDNELVEFMAALPSSFKIRGGVTKTLLRDVAADLLPVDVLLGRKQSFGTPLEIWLKNLLFDYCQEVFQSGRQKWSDWFDFDQILAMHEEHVEGKGDHGLLLWRLVVLLVWLDHYAGKVEMSVASVDQQFRVA